MIEFLMIIPLHGFFNAPEPRHWIRILFSNIWFASWVFLLGLIRLDNIRTDYFCLVRSAHL